MNFFWLIVDIVCRLHKAKGRGNQNEHIQRSTRFRKVSVQFMSVFCLEPSQSVLSPRGQTFHGSDNYLLVRLLRQKFQHKKLLWCSSQQRTPSRGEGKNTTKFLEMTTLNYSTILHPYDLIKVKKYRSWTWDDFDSVLYSDVFSSMMSSLGGGRWQCLECGYQSKSTNVRYHIESKHVQSGGHTCAVCGEFLRTRHGLNSHMSTKHRNAVWINIKRLFVVRNWARSRANDDTPRRGKMAMSRVWLSVQVNQPQISHWVQTHPIWGTQLCGVRRVFKDQKRA